MPCMPSHVLSYRSMRMRAQIRLYKRAGMGNAAVEVQEDMRRKEEVKARQREANDAKLLRQKSIGMEMRRRARLNMMLATQELERQQLQCSQKSEYAALVDTQAAEVHELQETVTA